jgi:hypothetical protein
LALQLPTLQSALVLPGDTKGAPKNADKTGTNQLCHFMARFRWGQSMASNVEKIMDLLRVWIGTKCDVRGCVGIRPVLSPFIQE